MTVYFSPKFVRQLCQNILLATVYFYCAKVSLSLGAIGGTAAAFWPPTGIALASLFIFGKELVPGVFLGASLANLYTGVPVYAAFGIGIGNSLEAFCGAELLRRFHFQPNFSRVRDVLLLLFFGAFLSTLISASIGIFFTWLGGSLANSQITLAWFTWWLGDGMANLVIAPVIFSAIELLRFPPRWQRILEGLAILILTAFVSQVIFSGNALFFRSAYPLEYLVYLFLIWTALRFAPTHTSFITLTISLIAVWNTQRHTGFFGTGELHEGLFVLQVFLGITAITGLILSASLSERWQAMADLSTINADLRSMNQSKSKFASMIAHELRTPLTAIKESIAIVLDGIDGPVTPEQKDTLELTQRNIDRLFRLTNDVLELMRVEAKRMKMHFEHARLHDIAREVFDFMRLVADKKNIRFTLKGDALAKLTVLCDVDKMKQVLINLIDNAVKHTPDGGEVELSLSAESDCAKISVRDTGAGVSAEDQRKIFDLFQQSGMQEPYGQGYGVGLAVSKNIVEQHNGRIELESQAGQGSKFTVVLPLSHISPRLGRS